MTFDQIFVGQWPSYFLLPQKSSVPILQLNMPKDAQVGTGGNKHLENVGAWREDGNCLGLTLAMKLAVLCAALCWV